MQESSQVSEPLKKKKVKEVVVIDADQAAAELCRRSLSFFVQEFWDTAIEEDLEWSAHMQIMCDELQVVYERVIKREPKLYDLIINIPPGTSKSTICTIMAPVWSWTRDASLRHITGSYSADLSTEHAVKSRDIVRSDKYKKYFPEIFIKPDEDNKTNYKTIAGGQRFSTSVGGTVTGVHAHILTYDDPINPKQVASQDVLKTANTYFDQTLSTRKVDKRITPLILIMQRLDSNDPTGHLLEKKKAGIRHICLPGTLEGEVKPAEYEEIYQDGLLDPERLGTSSLAELKIDLGEFGYAGQILQTPVPPGGLIWKRDWFIEVEDHNMPLPDWGDGYATDWDLAYTDKDTNAASAYVTSFKYKGKIYIDDVDWKWLEFPALINWMKTKVAPHYIEAKASGKSAKQTLVHADLNAIEVPVKGGEDKIVRARMATPTAEAGRVCVRKSIADRMFNDARQGILFFPRGHQKDLADALAQCLQRNSIKGARVAQEETFDEEIGLEDERINDDEDVLDLLDF